MTRGVRTLMDKRTTTKRKLGVNGCGRDFAFGDVGLVSREPNSHRAWDSTYT